jgi:hypothetical protein
MKTVLTLKCEIKSLIKDLAVNGMNLRRCARMGNSIEVERLLCCRTEILKSVVHRQGLIIEALENEAEYKEAA